MWCIKTRNFGHILQFLNGNKFLMRCPLVNLRLYSQANENMIIKMLHNIFKEKIKNRIGKSKIREQDKSRIMPIKKTDTFEQNITFP